MTTIENKVTLYIATHNITGKKYFGKTTKYFTEKTLQENYHGSGVYWRNHLRKHGDDVTMKIYGIFSTNINDINYVEPIALKFSEENNIVKDYDIWANQIVENGLDGVIAGTKMSDDQKLKISNRMQNKVCVKDDNGDCFQIDQKDFDNGNFIGVNKGIILTDNHKALINPTGRIHLEETKKKIGLAHKNKIVSDETKQKLSERAIGDEWKEKQSSSAKNRKQVTCPHCNKIGHPGNMKRWHFGNCKLK